MTRILRSQLAWGLLLAGALIPLTACQSVPADEAASEAGAAPADVALPDGYVQILDRGDIPAVLEPTFVAAGEAELPDDAWVLGVVIEGQARAYSLNLLNEHEVVNDRAGDTAFAAVW